MTPPNTDQSEQSTQSPSEQSSTASGAPKRYVPTKRPHLTSQRINICQQIFDDMKTCFRVQGVGMKLLGACNDEIDAYQKCVQRQQEYNRKRNNEVAKRLNRIIESNMRYVEKHQNQQGKASEQSLDLSSVDSSSKQ